MSREIVVSQAVTIPSGDVERPTPTGRSGYRCGIGLERVLQSRKIGLEGTVDAEEW
jgi:hypothetical protein